MKFYKNYMFTKKDPAIDAIRTVMQDQGLSYKDLADMSGVAESTYYNWMEGSVRCPQHATLAASAIAMGMKWALVPARAATVDEKKTKAYSVPFLQGRFGGRRINGHTG